MFVTNLSWSDSLIGVNGNTGFYPIGKGIVWNADIFKTHEGTGAGVCGFGTRKKLVSALDSTPQHSSQNCMPFRHAHKRI
jgi:hypothetical protein